MKKLEPIINQDCINCGMDTGRDAWLFPPLYLYDHQGAKYGPLCEECYEVIKKEEAGTWI